MISKKITRSIVSLGAASFLVLGAVSAFAQAGTTINVNTAADVTTPAGSVKATSTVKVDAQLQKIATRSTTQIDSRVDALTRLNDRVQGMKNISAGEKTIIANEIQTNITGLTTLKAKIAADTDVKTAQSDEKMILGSYRIYALIIPQGYIAAASDRITTTTDIFTTLSAKLQTRIAAAQAAGKDTTALEASLSDLNTKVADAKLQAQTAQNAVVSLTPDQGDKALLASNTAALKKARADIKAGETDLKAARADARKIVEGLKAMDLKAKATASSSASVQ